MAATGAYLSPVIVPALAKHTASVIFLHGLGDTGFGWKDEAEGSLRLPHVKYILPHAPVRPFTLHGGMRLPAWFDRYGMDWACKEDDHGIEQARQRVYKLIDDEVASGIPTERILLAGFSMGGALSLYAGLTSDRKLAGIVALSCFIMQKHRFPEACVTNRSTPVFYATGDKDTIVPLDLAQRSANFVQDFHESVQFTIYKGLEHSIGFQELDDIKSFMTKCLPRDE
ncbi:phospholipase/Carboxylesterase [Aphelenchoides avenae]|nr:phospholipase/Carboxylesterase [Aphelenchus avenae]